MQQTDYRLSVGPPPDDDEVTEETREFLQNRVASFLRFAGLVIAGTLLFRATIVTLGAGSHQLTDATFGLQTIAALWFLAPWVALRGRTRSVRFIQASEHIGVFGAAITIAIMARHIPIGARPELNAALLIVFMLVIRAVYVPSTPRYTATITAWAGFPLVISAYFIYTGSALDVELPVFYELFGENTAYMMVTITAVIFVVTTIVCAATSNVVYGLRQEMADIRRLGQYILERKLGEGGMGAVYEASHAMLRRPTAIKLLPPRKIGQDSLARFEREVQLTAQLTHVNTITIFDYGRTPDGVFYYAMELVNGLTLVQIVDMEGPLPGPRVAHILSQAAGALAEAHGIGLIHRDVKPANIMLCEQGGVADVVKLLDFGLVKQVDTDAASSLSSADVIKGTPQYMSPEQIRKPNSVGPASDIYSLGGVAYFLLTGKPVFTGSVVEVCGHHLHTTPVPPSERIDAEIPASLEKLVMACLEKEPEARPAGAMELQEQLLALDIGAWSPTDARSWWNANRADVAELRNKAATSASGETIAIDLAHRDTAHYASK